MPKFQFWKRAQPEKPEIEPPPVPRKFNVEPRTDVGTFGLPTDPDNAAKLVQLRRRRELLQNELNASQSAADPENRWQAEVRLIDQAIEEVRSDRDASGADAVRPGSVLPDIPVTDVDVSLEPVPTVRFRIGAEPFVYQEEIDWAERGFQLARSELHLEGGSVAAVIPPSISGDEATALTEHLTGSLFAFATDQRDRQMNGESLSPATLADLAKPDEQHGGWLDWAGKSPIEATKQVERLRFDEEIERLRLERDALLAEEARLAEQLPFVKRRMQDVETAIAAVEHPESS
jgi:hypothetical protein